MIPDTMQTSPMMTEQSYFSPPETRRERRERERRQAKKKK
jgi:hypothetical protein